MEKKAPQIIQTAEPFFLLGGSTGCLLVHGFTGTPKEMRLLGEYLNKQGHTVLGIRLAGHATHIEDMIRCSYQDWLASVEDGWHLLHGVTERIFVLGLSMGGVLSLSFAANFPIAGVVVMASPYEMPSKLAKTLGKMLLPLSKVMPKMVKAEDKWFNPEMEKDHVCYPEDPVRPGYELLKLLKYMHSLLPTLNVPALVIHTRDDIHILPENAEMLFENIGGPDKEHIWVENTSHNLVRDGDTLKVFQPVAEFIERHPNS